MSWNKVEKALDRRAGLSWPGLLAGAGGGLLASFVMNRFQAALAKRVKTGDEAPAKSPRPAQHKAHQHRYQKSAKAHAQQGPEMKQDEDVTIKTAEVLSDNVLHHKLTQHEKKLAGPIVHYAFGTTMGAVYGGLMEAAPELGPGAGLLFGALLWLGADEVLLPALGLAKWAPSYPLRVHASALGAHLVYGLTTDLVRRVALRGL